jgi:hypothetical protein
VLSTSGSDLQDFHINLVIGRKWEAGHRDDMCRHHIPGKMSAAPGLNEVATLVITHPKQSKDQLVSFFTTVAADRKFKSLSTELDLVINTTKELEASIVQNPHEITCAIDALD